MLRDKKVTFCAKMAARQVVDRLIVTLRPLCKPHLAGRWVFLLVLLTATPAMAVQSHGPPEGYYVHQMAHLFFAAALFFLLYLLHIRPVGTGKAWYYFKISLLFFLLWNIWTFTAHWLADQLPSGALVTEGDLWSHRFTPAISPSSLLYYITRFDHLLCVPAIWFLMLSLKTFCLEIASKTEKGRDCHE